MLLLWKEYKELTSTPSLISSTRIWNFVLFPDCLAWFFHFPPLENNLPSSLSTSLLRRQIWGRIMLKHIQKSGRPTCCTNLRFLRVFIVHNWFSLWVKTYTGFEVSLHGLASSTVKNRMDKTLKPCNVYMGRLQRSTLNRCKSSFTKFKSLHISVEPLK